jgi:hypothetical protein
MPARQIWKWIKAVISGAASACYSRGYRTEQCDMDFTPKWLMQTIGGSGTRGNIPHAYPRPSGHPARGRFRLRQVSWLAGRYIHLAFPKRFGFSGFIERMLVAYSCGGSSGIASSIMDVTHRIPVLAFDPRESKEPRTQDIVDKLRFTSTAMMEVIQDAGDNRRMGSRLPGRLHGASFVFRSQRRHLIFRQHRCQNSRAARVRRQDGSYRLLPLKLRRTRQDEAF